MKDERRDVLTSLDDKADVLVEICEALLAGREVDARQIIRSRYPHDPKHRDRWPKSPRLGQVVRGPCDRDVGDRTKLAVWRRDGFRDQYNGDRLVFPAALELISVFLPDEFPYYKPPQGRKEDTHQALYDLYASVDHVIPVCRADLQEVNEFSNLLTTSYTRNRYKDAHLLRDLRWERIEVGRPSSGWDGLTDWFLACMGRHRSRLGPGAFRYLNRHRELWEWWDLLRSE